jgi:hypothetical protein
MPEVPIGTRIKKYGIEEAKANLADLTIPANTEFLLSPKNKDAAKNFHNLQPTSIASLKEWIGAPASVKAVQPHGVLSAVNALLPRSGVTDFHTIADIVKPLPAQLTKAHTAALYAAAHQFVMTDVPLEPEVVTNLNKWIVAIKPIIIVFHWRDITVSAGAKLVMDHSHSVLFARNITIQKTGKIVAKASIVKIDCAGVKGN